MYPEIALKNGRPTVFEFYADWCEACREMAPAMLTTENSYEDQIDLVLLNVDNIRWQDLLDRYNVNGIPQLNFFDQHGALSGSAIGLQKYEQIRDLTDSLLKNEKLPLRKIEGRVSTFQSY